MTATMSAQPVPSWEDQIVPTLKKRLETEQAYLSHRLSTSSIPRSDQLAPSPSPTARAFPSVSSSARPPVIQESGSSSSSRVRTKSTPYGNAPAPPRQSMDTSHSRPAPIPEPRPSLLSTSQASYASSSSSGRSPSSSSPRPADVASFIPARQLSRPRSKSQLAPHAPLPTSHPPLPRSNIPVLKSRSPRPGTASGTRPGGEGRVNGGRGSLELRSDIQEGFIKHELPPFRVGRDEALRIAEWGYDLESADGPNSSKAVEDTVQEQQQRVLMDGGDEVGLGEKRKRAITMRNTGAASQKYGKPSPAGAGPSRQNGMSRSATQAVGLGHPSASSRLGSSSGSRSASSRQPPPASSSPHSPNLSSSTSSANYPRSASLNVLASPTHSRLGIAAHLVPPESSYTPPKGSNWDDVLPPAVAKKLGMGASVPEEQKMEGEVDGEEGELLAVEWDRDGTPVKWVRRPRGVAREGAENSPTPPSKQNEAPAHKPSSTSLRHKMSTTNLAPIRLPSANPSSLPSGPPSPAPFSNLQRRPSPSPNTSPVRLSAPTASRQPSSQSLRKNANGGGQAFMNPRPSPVPSPGRSGGQRREDYEMRGMNGGTGMGNAWGSSGVEGRGDQAAERGGRRHGGKGDEVGKGCGCVIM